MIWFALGWLCCAVYGFFLPVARRFFQERGCSPKLAVANGYLWPITVPLTVYIRVCHRLLLGGTRS